MLIITIIKKGETMENLHLKNLKSNTIHPKLIQKVMFNLLNNNEPYKQKN